MKSIVNILLIVIPYLSSLPLSLYIGSVLENIKNFYIYDQSLIEKKKNDDIEELKVKEDSDKKDESEIKTTSSNESINSADNSNGSMNSTSNSSDRYSNEEDDIIEKIPKSYLECFLFKNIHLKYPSKLNGYYTRFTLYFIILMLLIIYSKTIVPELSEVLTIKFWIPTKLSLKDSIIGFVSAAIFGNPWLDNPYLQMYTLNKSFHNKRSINYCDYFKNKKVQKQNNTCYYNYIKQQIRKDLNMGDNENESIRKCSLPMPAATQRKSSFSSKRENLSWNPNLHFMSKKKIMIFDIIRLICSCILVPIMEELIFRFFFYRFIIGGLSFASISFNTWRWSAAILSNIIITHFFYLRCYYRSEEWITGLVNGYLCTYSMVKQGQWRTSVNTHFLINLYVGLYVIITKKYKYWY